MTRCSREKKTLLIACFSSNLSLSLSLGIRCLSRIKLRWTKFEVWVVPHTT